MGYATEIKRKHYGQLFHLFTMLPREGFFGMKTRVSCMENKTHPRLSFCDRVSIITESIIYMYFDLNFSQ